MREENDYDGCISSEDEPAEKNLELQNSQESIHEEPEDSETSDSEDKESFAPNKSRRIVRIFD